MITNKEYKIICKKLQKEIDRLNKNRMDMNEILVDRDATISELEAEIKKIKNQHRVKIKALKWQLKEKNYENNEK